MAKVEPKDAQSLLDQINGLEKGIQSAGNAARSKLSDIRLDDVRGKVPRTAKGAIDETAWGAQSEDDQTALYERLAQVRDSLQIAAGLDGPTDPGHIMYGAYASNRLILAWTLIGFVLMVVLLFHVVKRWEKATGTDYAARIENASKAIRNLDDALKKEQDANTRLVDAQRESAGAKEGADKKAADEKLKERNEEATARQKERQGVESIANRATADAVREINKGGAGEGNILKMVILLGALGGSLHLVGSLVKYVGNRQLKRSWLLYYLSTPIAGAVLAPILYMLLRVGILTPTGTSASGTTISNLNLIAIYAFAALTGLFAKTATDKLAEVFKTAFRSSEADSKDQIGAEKPPGAPGGGKPG